MRIVCVIPAYNCSQEISQTLESVNHISVLFEEIWVIDNRSTDDTLKQVISFKNSNSIQNLRIFQNYSNINLGGTHKVAFKMAISAAFTHVVILHGDNQADPNDLLQILKIKNKQAIPFSYFGTRFSRKSKTLGYSKPRIAGNLLLNCIFSLLTLKILTDLGSGLNFYNLEQIKKIEMSSMTNEMSFNYDLILQFIDKDLPFKYFPISWSENSQLSNARNFQVFTEGLGIITRWRFRFKPRSINFNDPTLPQELVS